MEENEKRIVKSLRTQGRYVIIKKYICLQLYYLSLGGNHENSKTNSGYATYYCS